jgi:hypothetical protein
MVTMGSVREGTTEDRHTFLRLFGSRFLSWKRDRKRVPYSSSVFFATVWRRQLYKRDSPFQTPATIFEFPTSMVKSI